MGRARSLIGIGRMSVVTGQDTKISAKTCWSRFTKWKMMVAEGSVVASKWYDAAVYTDHIMDGSWLMGGSR